MFGIAFKKAVPSKYLLHFDNGKIAREGTGLAFFYLVPTSTIIEVPVTSQDVPFVFHEVTADFQQVTIQGQLTYHVVEPGRLAQLLDFSTTASGAYRNDKNPEDLLAQRLINSTQIFAKAFTERNVLRGVLIESSLLERQVLKALNEDKGVTMLGVEVLGLSVLSIRPTPEIARALEAEAREAIQRKSDQATYERRNAAVEEERRIKESELNTENAVETKRRQIEETKLAGKIALEEQRSALMDRWSENERKQADARAYGIEKTLKPLAGADWRVLLAASANEDNAHTALALAFEQLAANASKIGELNISPDLLDSLIGNRK